MWKKIKSDGGFEDTDILAKMRLQLKIMQNEGQKHRAICFNLIEHK